ncbi:hypothetical protein A1E_02280 [Rickettsia canadensis str. McKiel]|uniref:Uncharacterized protein n=1 Tax=Rickettsia canadensis (strain McKiel) TaxID=293613 RepID=A8EYG8_RICCK|nr:hypothetical protein A1E_02280 [Rickettsia canadensis str. McKiel]
MAQENIKPVVPTKPTSEQIKAWDEAYKKHTDLTAAQGI